MDSYTHEFDHQMDERVTKLWREGQFKEFCNVSPEYTDYYYGEGSMHDTVILLGMLGWDKYDDRVKFITELFPSSSTGQVNAAFPPPAQGRSMPHFTVKYSGNIREETDLPGLFAKANPTLTTTGIFPLAGIHSRMHWVDTWQMVGGQRDYAFVHMTSRVDVGRDLESHQWAGGALSELIRTHFVALMEGCLLALSFEIEELHPTLNFKQNDVRVLLRQRADRPMVLCLPDL